MLKIKEKKNFEAKFKVHLISKIKKLKKSMFFGNLPTIPLKNLEVWKFGGLLFSYSRTLHFT